MAPGCRVLFRLRSRSVRPCFRSPMPPTGKKSFAFVTQHAKQLAGTPANLCSNFQFFRGQPPNKISASQKLFELASSYFEAPRGAEFSPGGAGEGLAPGIVRAEAPDSALFLCALFPSEKNRSEEHTSE